MTSLTIRKILFATDFLESSRLALDYAVAMAHHFGAEILMLHATELPAAAHEAEAVSGLPSVSRKLAEAALNNLAQKVKRAGVQVRTRVAEGVLSKVILEATTSEPVDLLVLGVHGIHRGVSHLLLGSNTEKIVLAAPCPTLTVGAHVRAGVDLDMTLTGLLHLAPREYDSSSAATYAQRLAASFQVPLRTEDLVDAAERDRAIQEQSERGRLDKERAAPGSPSSGSFQEDQSDLYPDIAKKADSTSLIVTTVSAEFFYQRHLHPSFAYELIANAICPVITINTTYQG